MGDTKRAVEIMTSCLRRNDIPSFKGSNFVDETDRSIAVAVLNCNEDDFGDGFKQVLGYGSYHGSVTFSYSPSSRYFSLEVYFGAMKKSVSAMRDDADFVKDLGVYDLEVNITTYDPRHPAVTISKRDVSLDSLSNVMDDAIVMMSTIIE